MGGERPYFLSLLIQLCIAPFVVHDWDGFVFSRTVHDFLAGLTPYAVVEANPTYIHVGRGWPPLNTWYAYPPLPLLLMTPPLALAFASNAAPWMVRLALKLPFIAGTLGLAWVGGKLVRSNAGAQAARDWERMILLNPFLLFLSAAWGMFDAWMVALLLLSLLLVDRRREGLAGAAFGAATLVKLFPLFAAPALLFYVASLRGRRAAARFVGAAIATFAAVSLPFALPHWRGFVLQVLEMHLARAPQGLSLLSIAIESSRWAMAEGFLHSEPSFKTLSTLTFGLTLGVTALTTVAVARAHDSRTAASRLLGLFLGVLFTSKVLNEQYFVIPVALFGFVWCTSRAPWARFGYRAFTAGALVASLALGWHVFTFWPPGVADFVFGKRGYAVAGWLQSRLHLSAATFTILPIVLSVAVLAPAVVCGVRRVVRDCRVGARLIAARFRRLPARAIAAFVVLAPVVVQGASLGVAHPAAKRAPLDSSHRRVGAFYYLWWANPAHDPAVRDGNWAGVSEKPAEGYYTITAEKLRHDFRLARSNGIDLIVASFHAYDAPLLPAALDAAYEQDVAIAPLLEIGDIYSQPGYGKPTEGFAMNERTKRAVVALASKALDAFVDAPAAYRPAHKLALFVYDSYFTFADFSPAFSERLLEQANVVAGEDARARGVEPPPAPELAASSPTRLEALLGDGRFAETWRRAYARMYAAFWRDVRHDLEARYGPLFLFSGESWNPGAPFHHGSEAAIEGTQLFDASFIYSPSFVWVLHKTDAYDRNWQRWVVRSVLQAQYARGAGHPVVATVNPTYDDRVMRKKLGFDIPTTGPRGDTYDLTWQLALDTTPDLVLVSTWNEFFEGSAIEPTREHRDAFLARTRDWSTHAGTTAPRPKHALLLTGEASTHYAAGYVDPNVEGRYAHDIAIVAERELVDYSVAAVDVDTMDVDLAPYDLVIVEPGLDDRSERAKSMAGRLESWVRAGGRVLVSNASPPWQALSGAGDSSAADDATRVAAKGGALAIAPASRPRVATLPADAEVLLRYVDGASAGAPAAWARRVGAGVVVGTSLHVAGREPHPNADASALFCACVGPLLASGERCEDRDDAVFR